MLELEFAQLSDPGKVRGQNEDFIGYAEPSTPEQVRSHGWLFVLADGCGGHDRGEVASRMAVDTLVSSFYASPAGEASRGSLQRLVQSANTKICDYAAAMPGASSMATTLVACVLRRDRATVAHVGDSRCYLIRRGHAAVLTHDHTVVHQQIQLGLLSEEEAAASEVRHQLSRSVGSDSVVNADIDEHQLLAEDILLLSSDGLHGVVGDEEIKKGLSSQASLEAKSKELIASARSHGGPDNITVVLLRAA